jgi:ankyrin repeat protein
MRMMLIWCGVVLAALAGGCAEVSAASPAPLTDKDIRVSLQLAQQDKDGFPHAFRVTFENRSDHEGILTLPVPLPGRGEIGYPLPPTIALLVSRQGGRARGFTYAAIGAMRAKPAERVGLRPGERCLREYSSSDLYAWGRSGPNREGGFVKCFTAGPTEVRIRACFNIGWAEDRPEEPTVIESAPVAMRCSFDESLFAEEQLLEPSGTALHQAVRRGDAQAVERLLAQGADVGARDEYGTTPLYLAAEKSSAKIAEMLLAKGGSLEARTNGGETALYRAAERGNVEVVRLLLAKGAEAEARNPVTGWTSLHSAALEGHVQVAEFLLAAGVDPNAKDHSDDTPLCVAARKGYDQFVALLLERGAAVNAKGINGWTPLHGACADGRTSVVRLLLARGADVSIKDNNGKTPLALAVENGRKNTVQLLKEHGAKE